ncbi:UNVERIFIED_ORG: formate hydrogenlyase subunit 3/multisubunit Na+/H+ antiporter MnhD subunit [Xanthomonas axonopodis]
MFMIAAVAVAGLPPLSGFLAKAALLQHVPEGLVGPVWTAVLGSSLLIVIGLTRAGVRLFWRVPAAAETAPELQPPRRGRMRPVETAATVLLLSGLVAMTGAAGPLMHYTDAAAAQLRDPGAYVDQVRATTPQRRQP